MLRTRRQWLLIALSVVGLLALSGLSLWAQGGEKAALKAGDKAPDLSLQRLDGKTISLKSLRGKVVYVDFFATWCGPCMQALPKINELQKKYKGKGLVVLAVSLDQNEEAYHKLARDDSKGWAVTFAHDPEARSAGLYGFTAIPHGVLIDPQGTIKAIHSGYNEGMPAKLEKEVKPLLPRRSR